MFLFTFTLVIIFLIIMPINETFFCEKLTVQQKGIHEIQEGGGSHQIDFDDALVDIFFYLLNLMDLGSLS